MLGLGLSYAFSGTTTTESHEIATRENVKEDSRADIIGFTISGKHAF